MEGTELQINHFQDWSAMPLDFRLTEAINKAAQMQHNANRIARISNQLTYVNILLSQGKPVPAKLADEIAIAVGDADCALSAGDS